MRDWKSETCGSCEYLRMLLVGAKTEFACMRNPPITMAYPIPAPGGIQTLNITKIYSKIDQTDPACGQWSPNSRDESVITAS